MTKSCWGEGTFTGGDECGGLFIREDLWEIVNLAGKQKGTNTRAQMKRFRSSSAGPVPRCRADPGGNAISRVLTVIVSSLYMNDDTQTRTEARARRTRLRNVTMSG